MLVTWTDDHEQKDHDHVYGVVLNDTGDIAFRERRATPRGDYDGTIEAIAGLVEEAERSVRARCSVGIGMPGAISPAIIARCRMS